MPHSQLQTGRPWDVHRVDTEFQLQQADRARLLGQGGAPGYERPPAFWVYFPARDTVGGYAVRPLPPAPRVRPRRGLRSLWGWQLLAGHPGAAGSPEARPRRGGARPGGEGRLRQCRGRQGQRAGGRTAEERAGRGLASAAAARPRGRRLCCPCRRFAVERTGGRDMGRVRSARGPSPDLFHFPSHSAPGCAADGSSSRSAPAA